MSNQITNETPFKNLVEIIITNNDRSDDLFKDDLMFEIIKWQKMDIASADTVFNAMVKLGLEACHPGLGYNMEKFALMRNYFSEAEIDRMTKQTKGSRRKRR